MNGATGHFVQFFDDDAGQARTVAAFVHETVDAGSTCIVVATPERRAAVNAHLQSRGLDVAALIARYQYIELDARTLMASFVSDGRCDRPSFHRMFDTLMRQASSRGEPVRAYGEMVGVLLEDGSAETAIELEELWNELTREHDLTLFCGYSAAATSSSACSCRTRERIGALHSQVL